MALTEKSYRSPKESARLPARVAGRLLCFGPTEERRRRAGISPIPAVCNPARAYASKSTNRATSPAELLSPAFRRTPHKQTYAGV